MSRSLALILLVLPLSARAGGLEGLTLDAAQAEARLHAPEATEIEARFAGAKIRADDARRIVRDDPTLAARVEQGSGDERSTEVSLAIPLDLAGSFLPRRRSARSMLDASRFDREEALRTLDEIVAIAVADLADAQRGSSRSSRVVALYRVAAEAAREERQVGKGNLLESDAADLDYAVALRAESEASRALAQAQAELARLLGRPSPDGVVVGDPLEASTLPPPPDVEALLQQNPAVRAAAADADTARLRLAVENRRWLRPVEAEVGYVKGRQEIPGAAFPGPGASAVRWNDSATSLRIAVPLPLFDRNREARAGARSQALEGDSRSIRVQAAVREEIQIAWSRLTFATRAAEAFAGAAEMIDRDLVLLDKALQAGAMDSVTRAQALRRVEAAAEEMDASIHELRLARAAWAHRSGRAE